MNGSSSLVDDDDAGIGDGVAPAIFFGVEADQRAARNEDVAVDDRAADARVAADADARHQDATASMWQKLWTRTFGQSTLPTPCCPR